MERAPLDVTAVFLRGRGAALVEDLWRDCLAHFEEQIEGLLQVRVARGGGQALWAVRMPEARAVADTLLAEWRGVGRRNLGPCAADGWAEVFETLGRAARIPPMPAPRRRFSLG